MSETTPCAAPRKSCGTPSGWRQGGRCPHCRAAHNVETNRYRGLTSDQRAEALRLLRAGRTGDEAAAAIGKTAQSLSAAAARDGELRAALDGESLEQQHAARRGDFLAALVRARGNTSAAARALDISDGAVAAWPGEPEFAAVVTAVQAWLSSAGTRSKYRITDGVLDRVASLLEDGSSVNEAAAAAGVSAKAIHSRRSDHARLDAALTNRRPTPPGRKSSRTPEKEARLVALWSDRAVPVDSIAAELGVSSETVRNWRRQVGLPPRRKIRQEVPGPRPGSD